MLSPYHPMQLALGLILWSIWFVITYGTLSVVCGIASFPAGQGGITWINALLLLFALLTTVLLLHLARRCWHARATGSPPQRLIAQVAAGIYLMAAAATFFISLVTLVIPPCI